jgi:uncharacterized membrane protein
MSQPHTPNDPDPPHARANSDPSGEAVWTFRGYQMRPAEFNTAMVHFYRGEVQRSNTWRMRLDTTTNWAVVATGAAISFVFSSAENHYSVIILNTLLVTLFLWIEALRYRYYELWAHRVRLMETDFFGSMLVPPFAPSPDWAESLAETLLHPDFPISMWEAFGRRFRRNYLWIYMILSVALVLKIYLHPLPPAASLDEFVARAALGPVPGAVVLLIGLIYNGLLFAIGLFTARLNRASGEVLPRWGEVPGLDLLWQALDTRDSTTARVGKSAQAPGWHRPARKRQQLLTLIVSSRSKEIAGRIMKEMHRGVTALHGRGMYSSQERDVLLVAVTITEMPQVRALAGAEDPNAFVIVVPAQEVLGRGFQSL